MSKKKAHTIFNIFNQPSTKFFIIMVAGCLILIIPEIFIAITGNKLPECKFYFLMISGLLNLILGQVGLIYSRYINWKKKK